MAGSKGQTKISWEKTEAWEIDPVTGENISELEAWHIPQTPVYTSTINVSYDTLNEMRNRRRGGGLESRLRGSYE